MVHQKIRVLIADDDIDFCFVCKEQINLCSDAVCCGVAHDGREALQKIEALQPDVLLLDDIMPIMDGIGVLEYLQMHPPAKLPHIIANSASGQDRIARALLDNGAEFFLEKPFEADLLLRRIRTVCAKKTKGFAYTQAKNSPQPLVLGEQPQNTVTTVEKLVLQFVLLLGVPTKRIGHDYIQEALCILLQHDAPRPTLKQIYNTIAKRHGSDGRCVENAIASAIKAALLNKTPTMVKLLSMLQDDGAQTISNGEFLTLSAQHIRWEWL